MSASTAFDTGRYPAVGQTPPPRKEPDRTIQRITDQLQLDALVVSSCQGLVIWEGGGEHSEQIAAIAPLWVAIRDAYGERGLSRLKRRFDGTWVDELSVRRVEFAGQMYFLSAIGYSIPSRSLGLHQLQNHLERTELLG